MFYRGLLKCEYNIEVIQVRNLQSIDFFLVISDERDSLAHTTSLTMTLLHVSTHKNADDVIVEDLIHVNGVDSTVK